MLRNLIVTSNTYRAGNRSPALDFLRGIAVILVLLRHCAIEPEQAGALQPLAFALKRFGWTGVDMFFVLSGFLVGGEVTAITLARVIRRPFVGNRAARVLPRLAGIVPMKTKLGQNAGDGRRLLV